MGTTVMIRSSAARALGAAMVLVAVVAVVVTASQGVSTLAVFGAPLVLFGVLGWAAFWQPHVAVSDGGVTVANTLRTLEVPWPAITDVDGRYGLRLETAYGRVVAWGAAAPVGRQRAKGRESEAARAVSERLHELRAAGFLDAPRLERPQPEVRWHRALLTTLGLLALAAALLPLLG